MIKTNLFSLAAVTGALWVAAGALLAYDCSGGATLVTSTLETAALAESNAILGTASACELSRLEAIAGETGVRVWNSIPPGIVAIILLHLLRRHLSSHSR